MPSAPRRRWRRALVALGIAAASVVALRAALPWALARVVEWQARSQLALPVRVGNVDLWLASGALAVEDLVVGRRAADASAAEAPPDEATALLRLHRFFVDLAWRDLLDRRIHLEALSLDGPALRVERDAEGRIDPLGPPLAPPGPEEPPTQPEEPSEPWTFALDRFDLHSLDLRLVDLASGRTPVEFALQGLALEDVRLEGNRFGLGGIEIESPALRIDRDFALAPRAAGGAGAQPAAAPSQAEAPDAGESPSFEIERIAIRDADFTLRTSGQPLDVSIRLAAEHVNARTGETFPIDLALGLGDGKIALAGRLGLNPPRYDGHLTWSDLALPPLTVAARPELAEWVRSCQARGDLDVAAHVAGVDGEPPEIRLSGSIGVRDLQLADPGGEQVSLAWKDLEIGIRELFVPLGSDGEATRVALERVSLASPDVRYTRPAPALEALLAGDAPAAGGSAEDEPAPAESAAGAEPAAASAEAEGSPGPPAEIEIDELEVKGGRLVFRDDGVTPPVETRLRDLAVSARDLRLPDRRVRELHASAIVPDAATLSVVGDLDGEQGDLRLALDRLRLPPFSPYAATAGYDLSGGEASLASRVRLRGASTEIDSSLELHRLGLSSRDPGAFEKTFGMPIDLALALLRDPRGDISLDIPLAFDASGARTGLAKIVRGALRQALVGALSSPLKLAGALLPTGRTADASFAPLAAVPGGAELAPGQEGRIEPLARLLAARPALALRVVGRAGPTDRDPLAEAMLVESAVADESWPEVEGSGFLARRRLRQALAARGRGETPPELDPEDRALLERTIAAVSVPPARLRALAEQRAAAVRDALAAELGGEAARVLVGEVAIDADPSVEVELAAAPEAGAR